jgi:chromosome segregation ATPase
VLSQEKAPRKFSVSSASSAVSRRRTVSPTRVNADRLRGTVEAFRQLVNDWDEYASEFEALEQDHARLLQEHEALRLQHDDHERAMTALRAKHAELEQRHAAALQQLDALRDEHRSLAEERERTANYLHDLASRLTGSHS